MISKEDYGKSKHQIIYEYYLKFGKRISIILPKDNSPNVAYFGSREISNDRIKSIYEEDNYVCIYCGNKTDKPRCDHIIPVCLNGSSAYCNLATACFDCNNAKGNKTIEQWLSIL